MYRFVCDFFVKKQTYFMYNKYRGTNIWVEEN